MVAWRGRAGLPRVEYREGDLILHNVVPTLCKSGFVRSRERSLPPSTGHFSYPIQHVSLNPEMRLQIRNSPVDTPHVDSNISSRSSPPEHPEPPLIPQAQTLPLRRFPPEPLHLPVYPEQILPTHKPKQR